MIDEFQEKFSKFLGIKKKEDMRTIFIMSLTWYTTYVNWVYILEIQNRCKLKLNYF